MGLLAIELHDTGIRAARSGQDELLAIDGHSRSSPGFARIHKKNLTVGMAAAQQSCAHPLQVDNRFWDQLDTEPSDPKHPASPNHAEVAYAHLQQIFHGLHRSGQEVVIAVPSHYENKQLRILVGIARELKMPLKGLVASPVALDPDPGLSGPVMIVDLWLHRCVLSVVQFGESVSLSQKRICPDVGLDPLRRQWINAMGDEFVRSTRFDPLHDAVTEQKLHDQMQQVLDGLAQNSSYAVELPAGTLVHRVTLTDQLLAHAGHSMIFGLCAHVQAVMASCPLTAVLLTHEVVQVPGLLRILQQQITIPVINLEAGAAVFGLLNCWPDQFDQSRTQGVTYHLSRVACQRPDSAVTDRPTSAAPTHLLLGDQAHRLQSEPLFMDAKDGMLRIGGQSGMACLRMNRGQAVLEVQGDSEVRVNGQGVTGNLSMDIGAQISLGGCSETIKLIALTS